MKIYLRLLMAAVAACFTRKPRVEFCNVGEGVHADGVKTFLPDATTSSRYLLYKGGSDADHCAICGAGETPLGPSDDQVSDTGVPIAINLLGAVKGTVRVVTDGSSTNGTNQKAAANGQVTDASNGDVVIGKAIIGTDNTKAAGDVIEMIPILPAKHPF